MADLITFPLGFESSAAYATVNKLAAYAQKRFSSIGLGGGNDRFTEMDRSARKFARTLEFANDRMVAFAASTTIVYGLGKAFSSLYHNALQAEKALAEIQVNIKLTAKEMSQLTSELFIAANKTGQSFDVAAEAAAEFGRQGLKAADVAKATHSALVLSQISGMKAADSVKALTSAMNTFGASSADHGSLVNKMAAADTNFAVSSKDLADAISRVGSTAKDAGVSVDQLLAIVTSLQQSTARGGAVIGNSLKTIFTRLQRNDVATALENLGIQTRDADGNFLNQINVLERLAKSYDNLSESQQSVISEKLGGVYQINIVKGIIQDLSRETSNYSQALYTVEKAQNEAFLKSEFLGKTTLNKINAAKNAFIQLSEVIGSMGITSSVSMWATEFANMATDIATSLKKPLEEKSGWDKAGAAFVQGLISAVTGPALGTAIIGTLKLGWRVLRNVGSDLGGTFSGNGQAQLFARLKARSEEANKIFLAIQSEKELNMAIQRGNQSLAQRISLMSRMSGSTIPIPQVPFSAIPRKATGHIPAMIQEMADVSAGVGGANKNARPVKKKLILSPGGVPQDVIVNTHEKIVRNYMGSGADAVFNPDMIRQVGGGQNLRKFGQVENLARGSLFGVGATASFYKLKNNIGVKRFNSNSSAIRNEFIHSSLLANNSVVPAVTAPQVYGNLSRSLSSQRIGKEIVQWGDVGKSDVAYRNSMYPIAVRNALEALLHRQGIEANDLHGTNVKENHLVSKFFANKRNRQVLEGSVIGGNGTPSIKRLNSLFSRLERFGGKYSIIDTGHFGMIRDSSPFSSEAKKIIANGKATNNLPTTNGLPIHGRDFVPNWVMPRVPNARKPISTFLTDEELRRRDVFALGLDSKYLDPNIPLPQSPLGKLKKIFGFARGFTPNLARGKFMPGDLIGSGNFGSFFGLRSGIGVKRLSAKASPLEIMNEFAYTRILSENSIIPGVTGPRAIGGIKNSVNQKRIGKEIVNGIHPFAKRHQSSIEDARQAMTKLFLRQGIPAADLVPKNLKINDRADKFLSSPVVSDILHKRLGDANRAQDPISRKRAIGRLNGVFRHMNRFGGQISILDPGIFLPPDKNSPFAKQYKNIFKERWSAANGFIPNLARGKKGKTPNFTSLSNAKLISVLKNPNSLQNQRLLAQQTLQKRGVFDNPKSILQGLPVNQLSNKALTRALKTPTLITNPILANSINQLAQSRGIFNNPHSVLSGVPINSMSNSALKTIASSTSMPYQMYAAQAQGIRSARAQQIATARFQARSPVHQLAQQRGISVSHAQSIFANQRPKMLRAYDSSQASRYTKTQKNSLASMDFSSRVAERMASSSKPITKKELIDLARRSSSATGGEISDKEIKEVRRHSRNAAWGEHSNKMFKVGAIATFGAGALSSVTGNEAIGNMASSIGFGASIGSAFGPIGSGIGAAAGALVGLANAAKSASIPMNKIEGPLQALETDFESLQSSIQSYTSSTDALERAIKDPSSSLADISLMSRQRAQSLVDLTQEQRSKLLAADPRAQKDLINEFLAAKGNQLSSSNAIASIVANADKENTGLGIFARSMKDTFNKVFKKNAETEPLLNIDFDNVLKSLTSLFASIPMKDLEKMRDAGNQNAQDAINAFNRKDIQDYIGAASKLGLIDKDVASASLATFAKIEKKQLSAAFSSAAQEADKLAKEHELTAASVKIARTAFEDFKKYTSSFNKINATRGLRQSTLDSVGSARLDILSQFASEPTRNALDYIKAQSRASSEFATNERSLKQELMGLFSDIYSASGRSAIAGNSNQDFLTKLMDSGLNDTPLEELLAATNKQIGKNKDLTEDQKNVLNEINAKFSESKTTFIEAKQIAAEQLRALNEISRKQQFDKLLSAMRSRNGMALALSSSELTKSARSLLNPTEREKRTLQFERSNAIMSKNPDSISKIVQSNVGLIKRTLTLDDQQKEAGLAGLPKRERTALINKLVSGESAQFIDARLALSQGEMRGRNLPEDLNASRQIQIARLTQLGSYGGQAGSIENISKAIGVLSQINPENKVVSNDIQALINYLQNELGQKLSSSGGFKDFSMVLADEIKKINDKQDKTSIDKKILESLDSANTSLLGGNAREAVISLNNILRGSNMPEDQQDVFKKLIQDIQLADRSLKSGKGDQLLANAADRNTKDRAGLTDFSALFVKNSDDFNTNLRSLSDEINGLSSIMAREAKYAFESTKIKRLSDERDEKRLDLNKLLSERASFQPSSEQMFAAEVLQNNPAIMEFLEERRRSAVGVLKASQGDKAKQIAQSRIDDIDYLKTVFFKGALNTNQLFDQNATSSQEDRNKADKLLKQYEIIADTLGDTRVASLLTKSRENLLPVLGAKNPENQTDLNNKISDLGDTIRKLTETIEAQAKELESRRAADEKTETKTSTTLDVNVINNGIGDKIAKRIAQIIGEEVYSQIESYHSNSNLYFSQSPGTRELA